MVRYLREALCSALYFIGYTLQLPGALVLTLAKMVEPENNYVQNDEE